jgi:hypothetical protein
MKHTFQGTTTEKDIGSDLPTNHPGLRRSPLPKAGVQAQPELVSFL